MKILLVEDSPHERHRITRALNDHDPTWEVETVELAEEALRRLSHGNEYDLAFLDISLSTIDGLQILNHIPQGEAFPRVVLITGQDDQRLVSEAIRCDALDYVMKTSDYLQQLPAVVQRVVERQQVELALQQSEERYRALFNSASDAILILDNQGRCVDANQAVTDLLGYSCDELLKLSIWDLIPTSLLHERRNLWRDFIQKGMQSGEYTLLRKNGSQVETDYHAVADVLPGQHITLMLDTTRRKRQEEQLRRRTLELETLLAVSQQLAGQLDLDELLDTIAQSIPATLPAAETASLWLYDEASDQLVLRAWAGDTNHAKTRLVLPPDTGLVGLVYRTGKSYLIDDVTAEAAYKPVHRLALDEVDTAHSVVAVPLLVDGQSIGALFADNYSNHKIFDDNDLRLLESLSGHAAIGIKNAHLFVEVQEGRQHLAVLSRQMVATQESERRHLARELHDEIGGVLTGLTFALAGIERMTSDDALRTRVKEVHTSVRQLMEQISQLSRSLCPSMLDDLGLVRTLAWYTRSFSHQTNIGIEFKQSGLEEQYLTLEIKTVAYRIVQEALTNVARHAGIGRAAVRIWTARETLWIRIQDEGSGFDVQAVLNAESSTGLRGMYERVALVGGLLNVESAPGIGTTVTVSLPYSGEIGTGEVQ